MLERSSYLNTGPDQCIRTTYMTETEITTGQDQTGIKTIQVPGETRVFVQEAWLVTWDASDRSTLTPMLPDLTNFMSVPTWTPGEIIPKGKYDPHRQEAGSFIATSLYMFICIGIPLLSVAFISPCVWCCVSSRRKNRRQQKLATAGETVTQQANSCNELK